ncbi:MAG: hypothetical protein HN742_28455 [Lentisphaerae bacterium]|jgi:hypothetical protein|nr:hypothetical protein [Lentisphaerota bacterium]MBT4814711.1 hypothetical protein [Lentisphaerota bacterium]MBT5611793.1 hypothetical protein [Lentisphaerota bacterium]MBT7057332.1 hypothetical protein [Lentisphaerota bacterium]MBT7845839.1 hypothetical protein [Lentisphaerota bacterium]
MTIRTGKGVKGGCLAVTVLLAVSRCCLTAASEPAAVYLSDLVGTERLTSRQAWGALGRDTATVPLDGRTPSQLRLGERVFERGLGHHAGGEIRIALSPHDVRFLATVGVHWQGGKRGSLTIEVWVDDERRFASGVLSDSVPGLSLDIPVVGGQALRLVATDGRNGIGCDMVDWCDARLLQDLTVPRFGKPRFVAGEGEPVPLSPVWCGVQVGARSTGPQILLVRTQGMWLTDLRRGETARLEIPVSTDVPVTVSARASLVSGNEAEVRLRLDGNVTSSVVSGGETATVALGPFRSPKEGVLAFEVHSPSGEAFLRWENVTATGAEGKTWPVSVRAAGGRTDGVASVHPPYRSRVGEWLLEWDWRMQDGIGTVREPVTRLMASARVLQTGRAFMEYMGQTGRETGTWQTLQRLLKRELARLEALESSEAAAEEALWRGVHAWRRQMMLALGLPEGVPIAFVKHAPGISSHQLTQYYGARARPGGGVFVLDKPGKSMAVRALTSGVLPSGNVQHLEAGPDGRRLLFAFCAGDTVPKTRTAHLDRVYHIYEINADGSGLRQLTRGAFDNFAPRVLPDGRMVFISTRRGGYHRCGRGPCPVYTLTVAEADGTAPRVVSYHETHEWDPCVMQDGRLAYTRWDYVDRSAVYYQQLWSVRPDGTDVRILYGNNTFNPVGIWEARAVPNSRQLMATAAAHHAMTAGSIILVDPTVGVDGLAPLTRLTPDALFPESEAPVRPRNWHATAGLNRETEVPEAARRWPGHCYRSPFPLSERLFLVAYSFDPLIGEGGENPPNMFGLYLCDAFGNKELLHRDLKIGSLWPALLRPHEMPPVLPSLLTEADGMPEAEADQGEMGRFLLADVYAAYPALPDVDIRALRVVQVLPKTTPNANSPRVGLANASPGKQVLGTVPVEADGSAYFEAPARIPLLFQALDGDGRAVQTMRSVVYLQPGETSACVGCHEPRMQAPDASIRPAALGRAASPIRPGPDGSKPLSYPLLVQPVLDRLCISCHGAKAPKGGVTLTGERQGVFTKSYYALAKRVPYSEWQGGRFRENNGEPLTQPDRFGSRASPLLAKLLRGHKGVTLTDDDQSRLVTWMDANALFYGSFNREAQKRQLAGKRINGPDLE